MQCFSEVGALALRLYWIISKRALYWHDTVRTQSEGSEKGKKLETNSIALNGKKYNFLHVLVTSPGIWQWLVVSDRTEPDMSFELLEPAKSPVQLKPDFWLEPMSRTLNDIAIKII